jgi:hypothetical protein
MTTKPRVPAKLGAAGKRLWYTVVEHYELDEHEVPLLESACRQADDIARLEALLSRGVTARGSTGQTRLHPAVAEVRLGRIALARLLGTLNLPADAASIAAPATHASNRARKAAEVRWSAVARRKEAM